MSNCAVCGKPVTSGIVVHKECWPGLALDNKPLTIEELRQMDGKPVWIAAKGINRYDIFCGVAIDSTYQFYKAALHGENYGKTWLAYRRKPRKWISVKDRLPESGEVIVSARIFGRNVVGIGNYINEKDEWLCFKTEICANVTHWMPLPAPPEVE